MQSQTNIRLWSERWRLGALDRDELIQIGLVSVVIGMMFMMFHMLATVQVLAN